MFDLLKELELVDECDDNSLPDDTPCHCENYDDCGWEGIISDCETAMDSEGWEYPEYEVLVCPKCGDYSIGF